MYSNIASHEPTTFLIRSLGSILRSWRFSYRFVTAEVNHPDAKGCENSPSLDSRALAATGVKVSRFRVSLAVSGRSYPYFPRVAASWKRQVLRCACAEISADPCATDLVPRTVKILSISESRSLEARIRDTRGRVLKMRLKSPALSESIAMLYR